MAEPLYFLVLFGDCGNFLVVVSWSFSKSYIYLFFIQKAAKIALNNFYNSQVVGRRKLPNPSPSNVSNLLAIGLRYNLSSEWIDFGLKCLVAVMPRGQPPKLKISVWNFPISEFGPVRILMEYRNLSLA